MKRQGKQHDLEVEEALVAVSFGHSFCPPVGRCCQMQLQWRRLQLQRGDRKMEPL